MSGHTIIHQAPNLATRYLLHPQEKERALTQSIYVTCTGSQAGVTAKIAAAGHVALLYVLCANKSSTLVFQFTVRDLPDLDI